MFKPRLSLAITAACGLTAISLPKYFSQHQHQMYALVGLLLPALFDFSTRHRWDRWLGDLSYPLYLVHWPVCVVGLAFLHGSSAGQASTNTIYAYVAVSVSIVLSLAINHFLVYPIDKWRQRRAREAGAAAAEPRGRQTTSVSA